MILYLQGKQAEPLQQKIEQQELDQQQNLEKEVSLSLSLCHSVLFLLSSSLSPCLSLCPFCFGFLMMILYLQGKKTEPLQQKMELLQKEQLEEQLEVSLSLPFLFLFVCSLS